MMTLYHYWRSSSSWRVRWALRYKQQEVNYVHVDLLNGESESPEHLKRNPLGYVPVLEVHGNFIIESLSIIEWLEEKYPERPLLPVDSLKRAHVRGLVGIIFADVQPVQNLTVLNKYSTEPELRKKWSQFFIQRGFEAYEKFCENSSGKFSYGDQITMADLFLIPQVYNANRFEMDMTPYPLISGIYKRAMKIPDVLDTSPERFQV